MDNKERFFDAVKKEMVMTLATESESRVTMRTVSPVYCDGSILIFTRSDSLKYRQLADNPNCCISLGGFFAEARAELLGLTMLDKNSALRDIYSEKFPGAFDEGIEFGGRDSDFVLFKLVNLSGWGFINDEMTVDGIPNVPFFISFE